MELKLKQAFQLSRIMKKMKIRPDYKDGMTLEQYGQVFFMEVIENISEAESEVYQFIADVKQIDKKDVEKWEISDLLDFVEEFKNSEESQRFLSQVRQLMKS